MIPVLIAGGILAALAFAANRGGSAHVASAAVPSSPPIGSAVSPTPSTPTPAHAIFPTPEIASLYETAVTARSQGGIPIVAAPQPSPAAAPVAQGGLRLPFGFLFPGSIAPPTPKQPAPIQTIVEAPAAELNTGGSGASRPRFSFF